MKSTKHSFIYAIGIFLQHVTSIVMLPIYTRFLTPEDYGLADLLVMGVELMTLILGVVSTEAIFRLYFEKKSADYKNKVVCTIYFTSLMINIIGYLIILLSRDASANYLFSDTNITNGVFLVTLYGMTIVTQAMSAVPMAYIRAEKKPVTYVFFSILRLFLAVSFNLYFIVFLELHIIGVVYAVFSFTLTHGLILSLYMFRRTGLSISKDIVKKSISFSFPIMLSSMALFFITYADRLFIKHYVSNSEMGLYSLAYKFGFILIAVSWAPFAQSWDAERYELAKQENAKAIFSKVFRLTQSVVLIAALGLSLFSQDLLLVMSSQDFHGANNFIGILVFAHIFNIWTHYCLFGLYYTNNTKYKAYVDWISLPVTLLLYFLLIPNYGGLGAAWATFFSLGIRFFLIHKCADYFYSQGINWSKTVYAYVFAVILYVLCLSITLPPIASLAFKSFIMLIYVGYIYFGGGLNSSERTFLNDTFRQKFQFMMSRIR